VRNSRAPRAAEISWGTEQILDPEQAVLEVALIQAVGADAATAAAGVDKTPIAEVDADVAWRTIAATEEDEIARQGLGQGDGSTDLGLGGTGPGQSQSLCEEDLLDQARTVVAALASAAEAVWRALERAGSLDHRGSNAICGEDRFFCVGLIDALVRGHLPVDGALGRPGTTHDPEEAEESQRSDSECSGDFHGMPWGR
jgi:hypothetical protein